MLAECEWESERVRWKKNIINCLKMAMKWRWREGKMKNVTIPCRINVKIMSIYQAYTLPHTRYHPHSLFDNFFFFLKRFSWRERLMQVVRRVKIPWTLILKMKLWKKCQNSSQNAKNLVLKNILVRKKNSTMIRSKYWFLLWTTKTWQIIKIKCLSHPE